MHAPVLVDQQSPQSEGGLRIDGRRCAARAQGGGESLHERLIPDTQIVKIPAKRDEPFGGPIGRQASVEGERFAGRNRGLLLHGEFARQMLRMRKYAAADLAEASP